MLHYYFLRLSWWMRSQFSALSHDWRSNGTCTIWRGHGKANAEEKFLASIICSRDCPRHPQCSTSKTSPLWDLQIHWRRITKNLQRTDLVGKTQSVIIYPCTIAFFVARWLLTERAAIGGSIRLSFWNLVTGISRGTSSHRHRILGKVPLTPRMQVTLSGIMFLPVTCVNQIDKACTH